MISRSPGLVSAIGETIFVMELIPIACPGIVAGRYELQQAIGLGRRACTYRAIDRTLCSGKHEARVVLKLYRPGFDEEQESLYARRIEHPSVARILDRGVAETGHRFAVIEYLSGGTLAELDPRPPLRQAVSWARDLARGVQAAHDKGVIHCDIKPENVLLTVQGVPKLADFDLACEFNHAGSERRGTVTYMAPELYRAEPGSVTPAADVYGLGALLFYLLTGRSPHGSGPEEAEEYLEGDDAPPECHAPVTLRRVIERALARDRTHRYRAAGEFADDLDRWLSRRPIDWMRPSGLEISKLWAMRNPALAVAGACAILMGLVGTVGAYGWNLREREHRIAMQLETNRLAQIEIEQAKAKLRRMIEDASNSLLAFAPSEEILPIIGWTHWLGTESLVADDGEFIAGKQHVEMLRRYVEEAETLEGPDGLYGSVMRFALGQALLDNGQPAEAQACFERILTAWGNGRAEHDLLIQRCKALNACSMAEQASFDERDKWARRLDAILSSAEHGVLGNRITKDLVRTRDELAARTATK